MKNIEKAVKLYKKFIEGSRWLNAKMLNGDNTKKDMDDFDKTVCVPLDSLWKKLTHKERDCLDDATKVIGIFSGTIELSNVRGVFLRVGDKTENEKSPFCPCCGKPGQRYCLGSDGRGWGLYCLKCEPY